MPMMPAILGFMLMLDRRLNMPMRSGRAAKVVPQPATKPMIGVRSIRDAIASPLVSNYLLTVCSIYLLLAVGYLSFAKVRPAFQLAPKRHWMLPRRAANPGVPARNP
jgi:hypothetical protein